jgi:hypothetical protein
MIMHCVNKIEGDLNFSHELFKNIKCLNNVQITFISECNNYE